MAWRRGTLVPDTDGETLTVVTADPRPQAHRHRADGLLGEVRGRDPKAAAVGEQMGTLRPLGEMSYFSL